MATKAEFLAQLKARFHKVGIIEPAVKDADFNLRKNQEGFSFYRVGVYYKVGEAVKRGIVFLQVEDEGGAGETAFWEEKIEPKFLPAAPATVFHDAVELYVNSNKPAGYLAHDIKLENSGRDYAVIRLWRNVSGEAVVTDFLLTNISATPIFTKLAVLWIG